MEPSNDNESYDLGKHRVISEPRVPKMGSNKSDLKCRQKLAGKKVGRVF